MARQARSLHAIEADTSRMRNIKDIYRKLIECNTLHDRAIISRALDLLDSLPEGGTCVHGDFHFGNIITDGKRDYLIDLSTFGYGDPDWDISMQFLVSHSNGDKMIEYLFHVTDEQAIAFWQEFKADYYGPGAPSDEELFIRFKPYMLLRTLFFEHDRGPDQHVAAMREAFV